MTEAQKMPAQVKWLLIVLMSLFGIFVVSMILRFAWIMRVGGPEFPAPPAQSDATR